MARGLFLTPEPSCRHPPSLTSPSYVAGQRPFRGRCHHLVAAASGRTLCACASPPFRAGRGRLPASLCRRPGAWLKSPAYWLRAGRRESRCHPGARARLDPIGAGGGGVWVWKGGMSAGRCVVTSRRRDVAPAPRAGGVACGGSGTAAPVLGRPSRSGGGGGPQDAGSGGVRQAVGHRQRRLRPPGGL